MWPFSKKWSAPEPKLALLVSIASEQLPSPMMLANPSGRYGAVVGVVGPADGDQTKENMADSMSGGHYMAVSPSEGGCSIRVVGPDPASTEMDFSSEALEAVGLSREMLDKFNRPKWRVGVELVSAGNNIRETVNFITNLAKRLAELGDGVVRDVFAYRFFGAAGWSVENQMPEFDIREHVQLHIVSGSRWFHTHGMIKFGRPEIEIYDVPLELDGIARAKLLDVSQYTITSVLIKPGQTAGNLAQPFYAREGKKNRDHWQTIPVLELVDVDERGKPVPAGAPKALQFRAGSTPSR